MTSVANRRTAFVIGCCWIYTKRVHISVKWYAYSFSSAFSLLCASEALFALYLHLSTNAWNNDKSNSNVGSFTETFLVLLLLWNILALTIIFIFIANKKLIKETHSETSFINFLNLLFFVLIFMFWCCSQIFTGGVTSSGYILSVFHYWRSIFQ